MNGVGKGVWFMRGHGAGLGIGWRCKGLAAIKWSGRAVARALLGSKVIPRADIMIKIKKGA